MLSAIDAGPQLKTAVAMLLAPPPLPQSNRDSLHYNYLSKTTIIWSVVLLDKVVWPVIFSLVGLKYMFLFYSGEFLFAENICGEKTETLAPAFGEQENVFNFLSV